MGRIFERVSAGAGLGCTIGGALGTLLTGVTIALPGINIILAPVVAAATVATVAVSGAAAGTLVGATAGAISGVSQESKDRRRKCDASV